VRALALRFLAAQPQKSKRVAETTGEFFQSFWDWETSACIKGRLARSPNSIGKEYCDNNKALIKRYVLPRIGKTSLADLRGGHIEPILVDLKESGTLSPRTINYVLQAVRVSCREACRLGTLPSDPTAAIRRFGVESETGSLPA